MDFADRAGGVREAARIGELEFVRRSVVASHSQDLFLKTWWMELGVAKVSALPSQVHRLDLIRFDSILVARVVSSGMSLHWPRRSRAARRRYVLLLVTQGELSLESADQVTTRGEHGIGMIFPGASTVSVSARSQVEAVIASVDSMHLRADLLEPPDALLESVDSLSVHGAYAFLHALATSPRGNSSKNVPALKRMIASLVEGVLDEAGASRQPFSGMRPDLASLRHEIRRHAGVSRFGPQELAEVFGVSRRTLERWASEEGLSIREEIEAARVRRAVRLLRQYPRLSNEELARLSGFGAERTLRRASTRLLSRTPTELRMESEDLSAILLAVSG